MDDNETTDVKIIRTSEELSEAVQKAEKGEWIVFDEAGTYPKDWDSVPLLIPNKKKS